MYTVLKVTRIYLTTAQLYNITGSRWQPTDFPVPLNVIFCNFILWRENQVNRFKLSVP